MFVYAYERSQPIIDLRNKLAKIVTKTKKSNNAKRFFKSCQKSIGMKTYLMLIQQVSTRWNSLYLMLERFEVLAKPLALFFQDSRYSKYMITGEEWTLIRELLKVLRPLYDATLEMSGMFLRFFFKN